MSFQLKNYQQRAVDVLADFLNLAYESGDMAHAFTESLNRQGSEPLVYRDYGFEQVPYVCLRIPTGGGKTILGSYAIELAAKNYMQTDTPIALWLVPTNTIRLQTVEALKTPGHPYRARLDAAFNHQVLVLDIDEVTQIRPQDIGQKTIVVVSTMATLRVNNTSGRKVYAYHENFEPHFRQINQNHPAWPLLEQVAEDDLKENGLKANDLGQIKYSFANLLAVHRPVLIVDEAHNARTKLTFDTLKRIHPAAILEMTATPNYSANNGSNVLFHVSAAELKAEEMIKLPIILTEHQNWQQAINDAVLNRKELAKAAQLDEDYIRPIALFQAEAKNGEVTHQVLKQYLMEDLNISENKIAVVTGAQRELDGIDLFSSSCPIEFIITVEALKEGWDCSFAYVFCSVKQVSSSKDAEQLLGRVLRMPYAKRRMVEDLNRAYAHLATDKFSKAANELTDKLIAMGFEAMEVAAFLKQQASTSLQTDAFGDGMIPIQSESADYVLPFVAVLPKAPDFSGLDKVQKNQVTMSQKDKETVISIKGDVSDEMLKALIKASPIKKQKDQIKQQVKIYNSKRLSLGAPSERGELFAKLPMLCSIIQGELELVEKQSFLTPGSWDLSKYPAELPNFELRENTMSFSLDVDNKQVTQTKLSQSAIYDLNFSETDVTAEMLVRWLDRKLKQVDVIQSQMIRFLSQLINGLLKKPEISLTVLVRNKFPLSRAIAQLIKKHRLAAEKAGYQACLFGDESQVCLSDQFCYSFSPKHYPSTPPFYTGRYQFQKHYFPQNLIEDLKDKGEEYECAKVIDSLSDIKYWIRNLVRKNQASFWLPLAHNNFYPDFVCELNDGRMMVIEYKGKPYESNDDSAEKRAVGELWASKSDGKCLFLMAVEQDDKHRDVRQQIQAVINKA